MAAVAVATVVPASRALSGDAMTITRADS
jgi:hypothetical protein